jgi:hypothetical protein
MKNNKCGSSPMKVDRGKNGGEAKQGIASQARAEDQVNAAETHNYPSQGIHDMLQVIFSKYVVNANVVKSQLQHQVMRNAIPANGRAAIGLLFMCVLGGPEHYRCGPVTALDVRLAVRSPAVLRTCHYMALQHSLPVQ